MSAAWAWLVAGLVLAVAAPKLLNSLVRRGVDAQIVLLTWAALVSATVVSIALPAVGEVMHRCWMVLHEGRPDRADAAGAALSVILLFAAAVRAGWALRRSGAARRELHERHLGLARILSGAHPDHAVLWLPIADPVAYSVAGHPPLVVVSTGLRDVLDTDALVSVLAHERAHLARGHHRLVTVAEAAAAGFWWLPLMRTSPALVRTLVELDADACAAQVHGPRGLTRALQALQPTSVPRPALGVAGDSTGLRLTRLAALPPRRALNVGAAPTLVASLAAALLPVVSIATVAVVTALASCVS